MIQARFTSKRRRDGECDCVWNDRQQYSDSNNVYSEKFLSNT